MYESVFENSFREKKKREGKHMRNEALLEELTQAFGVAGFEGEVREIIRREAQPYADEIREDAMGNLIVLKKGMDSPNKKRIMFAAHMDEIGFMVKKILPDGTLLICNLGWNWAGSVYNERVRFRNGVTGVVGCRGSIEDAKNDVKKLFVDIGAKDAEDAKKYVRLGDPCGYMGPYLHMQNDLICSKSLDNRIGCWQLLEALRDNDGSGPNDVYYVFTVQEELGCRGSGPAAEAIRPDIGVAVDITPAHDYPCDLEGSNEVGKGVAVKVCDPSVVCDERIVSAMETCCRQMEIPYQLEVIDQGGTDASSMNLSHYGVRVGGIAVATRYPHCQSCVASLKDIEAGARLCTAFAKREFIWG